MITLGRAVYQTRSRFDEYWGLGVGTKPLSATGTPNIPNGSTLYCMDNQVAFMYDAENDEWRQHKLYVYNVGHGL